jgi:hypothetical protein
MYVARVRASNRPSLLHEQRCAIGRYSVRLYGRRDSKDEPPPHDATAPLYHGSGSAAEVRACTYFRAGLTAAAAGAPPFACMRCRWPQDAISLAAMSWADHWALTVGRSQRRVVTVCCPQSACHSVGGVCLQCALRFVPRFELHTSHAGCMLHVAHVIQAGFARKPSPGHRRRQGTREYSISIVRLRKTNGVRPFVRPVCLHDSCPCCVPQSNFTPVRGYLISLSSWSVQRACSKQMARFYFRLLSLEVIAAFLNRYGYCCCGMYIVHGASCTLHVVRCMLHGTCCLSPVMCCKLYVVRCIFPSSSVLRARRRGSKSRNPQRQTNCK